jgi:hypothetical protein
MCKIKFRAGYYEWNVYLDNDCLYSFGSDISEEISEDTSSEDLKVIIDECIKYMQLELSEKDSPLIPENLISELKEQMFYAWSYHFGIEV